MLRSARQLARAALLCLALAALAACGRVWQAPTRPPAPARPILVLVSIDGFRWDYLQRFEPPTLRALAARGVRAEGLVPLFPTKTFTNHYTIATGLRPARHGIVSNNMVAPDIPGRFSMSNREVQADPRWWGGEPIWNTAERQGRVAASMFWPGSETEIGGRRPTHWRVFDDGVPNGDRITQVLTWLALPEPARPGLVTLYFSDVDTAGHIWGPDAAQTRAAVLRVDAALATLVEGVARLGLTGRVHYVIVSDHGMSTLGPERLITLDDFVDEETLAVIDWTPVLGVNPRDGDVDALHAKLVGRHPALAVYRKENLPEEFGLTGHPRLPAIVGIVADGWHLTRRRDLERWASGLERMPAGNHGYAPRAPDMRGLFVASGARLHSGIVVPAFESIHLYELMCAILDLVPAQNDGDRSVVAPMLR